MNLLNSKTIKIIIDDLKTNLVDSYLTNAIILNSSDIIFTFSQFKGENLFVSLNHSNPFISLAKVAIEYSSISNLTNETLKREIKNSCVKKISQLGNDRIVEFCLEKVDDYGEIHNNKLIFQLIPCQTNLLILDDNDVIKFAIHYTDLTNKIPVIKGLKYNVEEREDYISQIHPTLKEFKSFAILRYKEAINKRNKEKYKDLETLIKNKYNSAIKKTKLIDQDLIDAENKLQYKEHADTLLSLLNDTRQVEEYFKNFDLPLDKAKSLPDNINSLYKLYKKAKQTIIHCQEELIKNEEDIKTLQKELELFNSYNEDELISLTKKYSYINSKGKKDSKIDSRTPYFIEINNTKIMFGKNANQNDYLTFKLSNKEYFFFHIEGYTGSHVILCKKDPSEEDLLLAAETAIYISKKDEGSVSYTRIKNIKRGSKPGQVFLNTHKTIYINKIRENIKIAVKNAAKY